ncbi:alkaline phosphatase D family protein [Lutibacter sp.]|uniref:alkaline phosphatase D family protein n=1 Tax=Lutibacter sp. TaxID=1925666 RepID=UPI001A25A829|nr:alkaline phosphatase D family protein [Lutibacter sp.]MBI9042091.1 alkaline phosphatase family protein [Lutibacter sp.]
MNYQIKFKLVLMALIAISLNSCSQNKTTKIAFGSCGHQNDSLPIYNVVVKHKPDIFIFLGDNIYGDTYDMDVLKAKYDILKGKPSFQNLKKNTPIIATWDDHDFGWNDAGRHYKFKKESKEIFLDFFNEPKNSERRKQEGVYTSYYYEKSGKNLQVILLDVRTFRDDLLKHTKEENKFFYEPDYVPYQHADSTLLGATQWKWLEKELSKPADIRIIGSGSQFGIEYNGYEAWANFPLEQQKFFDLIKKTKANGVLFISGDVHYAEISKVETPNLYPIYDITSSGLSSRWLFATPNKNRIEGPVMENHFGLITINWKTKNPEIKMEIWDVNDNQRIEYSIKLDEISFKK